MRRSTFDILFTLTATSALAAGAGFIAAAFLLNAPRSPDVSEKDVVAECGFASGRSILDSTLRVRCGLEQSEIERLFASTVEGLGFDRIRTGGGPDPDQLREAAQRLGLTVDAVKALIARLSGNAKTAGGGPSGVGWAIEVAVAPDPGGPTGRAEEGAITLVSFAPEAVSVARADTPEEALLLSGVRAKCGAAGGGDISGSQIEVTCGPKAEEVQALIDKFVAASGAEDLRAALARDAAGRDALIEDLSAAFGLEDSLVDDLLARIEASNASDPALGSAVDAGLRASLNQAVLLLRIGAAGDALRERQAEIAAAIVAEDYDEAARLVQAAGEMLHPLADQLAPETPSPLVAAALLAEEARQQIAEEDFVAGIRSYMLASDAVAADWRMAALEFELDAATAMADPRGRAQADAAFGNLGDVASDVWIDVAGELHDRAIDLSLDAAGRLSDQAQDAVGGDRIDRATLILARLAPLVAPQTDAARYVELHARLAELHRLRATRNGDLGELRNAEAEANLAIETAEAQLGEDEVIRWLTIWAIVQLDLGRRTGQEDYLDVAEAAFLRVAAARDPDANLAQWASAQNNVAVVQQDKARKTRDAAMLSKAAETYRRIAQRIDPEANRSAWSIYTRNLANTLTTIGAWERESGPVREAIRELEKLRAAEAEGPSDLAAADTLEKLAGAWRQVGHLDRDAAAHSRAAALAEQALAIYDPESAPRLMVEAQLQVGDIRADISELEPDAGNFESAAATFAKAREAADASGQDQLAVDAMLRQARVLLRAQAAGALPEGSEDPEALVAALTARIDGVPGNAVTPEWHRLRDEATALRVDPVEEAAK